MVLKVTVAHEVLHSYTDYTVLVRKGIWLKLKNITNYSIIIVVVIIKITALFFLYRPLTEKVIVQVVL